MPLSVIHYVFFLFGEKLTSRFPSVNVRGCSPLGKGDVGQLALGEDQISFFFFFMRKNVAIPVWEMVAPLLFDWPKSMDAQRGSELAGNR